MNEKERRDTQGNKAKWKGQSGTRRENHTHGHERGMKGN